MMAGNAPGEDDEAAAPGRRVDRAAGARAHAEGACVRPAAYVL